MYHSATFPVVISTTTQPTLQMSIGRPISCLRITSGGMYAGRGRGGRGEGRKVRKGRWEGQERGGRGDEEGGGEEG